MTPSRLSHRQARIAQALSGKRLLLRPVGQGWREVDPVTFAAMRRALRSRSPFRGLANGAAVMMVEREKMTT